MGQFHKVLFILALCSSACRLSAQIVRNTRTDSSKAQGIFTLTPIKAALKTDLLSLFKGPFFYTSEYKLAGEVLLNGHHSILAGASYIGPGLIQSAMKKSQAGSFLSSVRIRGYRVFLGYRYYFKNPPLRIEGFYAGPYISYSFVKYSSRSMPSDYITGQKVSVSAIVGLQKFIADRVALDFFIGPGYFNTFWYDNLGSSGADMPNIHFQFTFGINVGVGF